MARSLPQFSAIKAFEAAARHGSFARAAHELDVTSTAISQHVKGLEQWLGKPLFIRRSNAVELTGHGAEILPDVTRILDEIASLLPPEKEPNPQQSLLVAVPELLLDGWLAPRLAGFHRDNPGILVMLKPVSGQNSLKTDSRFDFVISEVSDNGEDLLTDLLFEDALIPVCSEQFYNVFGLADRANWPSAPRVIDTSSPEDWMLWAKARASDLDVNWDDGARCANHWLAVEAARQAHGIFMAHAPLIAEALKEHSLVPLDAEPLPVGRSYHLIRRRGHRSPAAIQFRAWLLESVRAA